jgi:hypothetical protein
MEFDFNLIHKHHNRMHKSTTIEHYNILCVKSLLQA